MSSKWSLSFRLPRQNQNSVLLSLPARATFHAHHILHLTTNNTNYEAAHHAILSTVLLPPAS